MLTTKDGIMIVLSSPSGAGKTTLTKQLSKIDNYHISISHTTREPRNNEISGKDYYFVNNKQFKDLEHNNLPQHLDLDLSNFCNLKCTMCGPYASSQWSAEAKKNQEKFAPFNIGYLETDHDWINDEDNKKLMKEIIKSSFSIM